MTTPKLSFKNKNENILTDWVPNNLEDIRDKNVRWSITGGPFGSNLKAEDYTESGVRIIQLQNIGDGVFNDGYKIYTSEKKADELLSCNIYPGEIIISKMGDPVARCCFIPKNASRFLMSSDGIRLVVDESRFDKTFIHEYINSAFFRKIALENSTGSTRKRIGLSELKSIPVMAPPLSEQKKLGAFLESINDKISILTKRHKFLIQYKKGVMQKIFNQEIRFKDKNGNTFPEWVNKKVGDIFRVTRGNVLAMSKVSASQDDKNFYPVYSSQTKNNGLAGYFSQYLYEDAVTWTTDGANAGEVKFRTGKFYCTNVCGVLLNNEGQANSCLAYMINLVSRQHVSYVGNPKLMNNVMAEIPLLVPSINEQKQISTLIELFDKKIDLAFKELELTKQYKQGLLQQMFI